MIHRRENLGSGENNGLRTRVSLLAAGALLGLACSGDGQDSHDTAPVEASEVTTATVPEVQPEPQIPSEAMSTELSNQAFALASQLHESVSDRVPMTREGNTARYDMITSGDKEISVSISFSDIDEGMSQDNLSGIALSYDLLDWKYSRGEGGMWAVELRDQPTDSEPLVFADANFPEDVANPFISIGAAFDNYERGVVATVRTAQPIE